MYRIIRAVAISALFAVPAVSFAQSDAGYTRAQVRAELVSVEAAGYNPSIANDATYPADVQAADAKIAMQAQPSQPMSSVGGMPIDGSSAAGQALRSTTNSTCAGPVSFCDPYLGG